MYIIRMECALYKILSIVFHETVTTISIKILSDGYFDSSIISSIISIKQPLINERIVTIYTIKECYCVFADLHLQMYKNYPYMLNILVL